VNLQLPQSDIDFFYKVEGGGSGTLTTLRPGLSESSQFGPEITFGRAMADLLSGSGTSRVAIIKYANGGTNLEINWRAGGNGTLNGDGAEYLAFQSGVSNGLAAIRAAYPVATVQIEGMIWMQGESDATSGYQASYYFNLTNFIADIRATYGSHLPFVLGRLSSAQKSISAAALNVVQNAQGGAAAGDVWTRTVYTDGFSVKTDNLHFDAGGQKALGQAFAIEMMSFMRVLEGIVAPSQLTATPISPTRVDLAWLDNSTNETAFVIERSLVKGCAFAEIARMAAGETAYVDNAVVRDKNYYYRVTATNNFGRSLDSGEVSVNTGAFTALGSVPHTWLSSINPNWSTNYEAAVTNDVDGDGFATWQEYWSGTDPQNSNSFLRIDSVALEGGNALLKWQHALVGAGVQPLTIQTTTNLQSGPWVTAGQKAPVNGTNTWSGAALPLQLFYRLSVTNAP
jgi:hypothetical protein